MRPRERNERGEQDLFRSRLDQIIDMKHPLVALGRTVDWSFLEERFGEVYTDDPGRPPLPTRLMAGLAILKHTYDLSDEVLCERWVENPYYQHFCGEEFFQHRLVFDRSSLTRWRHRMGEERLAALIQESLSVATRTKAIKPSELSRVIVDTTVQPKNVTFPTDAKLLNRAPQGRRRTRHRPSQGRAPHGPQLSLVPAGRRHQRRPRRRRLQLPPPHPLAQPPAAPNPIRSQCRGSGSPA